MVRGRVVVAGRISIGGVIPRQASSSPLAFGLEFWGQG